MRKMQRKSPARLAIPVETVINLHPQASDLFQNRLNPQHLIQPHLPHKQAIRHENNPKIRQKGRIIHGNIASLTLGPRPILQIKKRKSLNVNGNQTHSQSHYHLGHS